MDLSPFFVKKLSAVLSKLEYPNGTVSRKIKNNKNQDIFFVCARIATLNTHAGELKGLFLPCGCAFAVKYLSHVTTSWEKTVNIKAP